jgi:hypothetical protein
MSGPAQCARDASPHWQAAGEPPRCHHCHDEMLGCVCGGGHNAAHTAVRAWARFPARMPRPGKGAGTGAELNRGFPDGPVAARRPSGGPAPAWCDSRAPARPVVPARLSRPSRALLDVRLQLQAHGAQMRGADVSRRYAETRPWKLSSLAKRWKAVTGMCCDDSSGPSSKLCGCSCKTRAPPDKL